MLSQQTNGAGKGQFLESFWRAVGLLVDAQEGYISTEENSQYNHRFLVEDPKDR